jgi:hypothetical protein
MDPRFKGRVLPKKKRLVPGKDAWSVVGYATADSYDLYSLAKKLHEQGPERVFWKGGGAMNLKLESWWHCSNVEIATMQFLTPFICQSFCTLYIFPRKILVKIPRKFFSFKM